MSDVVRYFIKGFEIAFPFLSADERLQALGQRLMNFGAMPAVHFGEFIRVQFWEQTSAMINMAEQLLDTSQYAPDFWVDDLEEYSHNLREALLIKESITPFDLKEHINGETRL